MQEATAQMEAASTGRAGTVKMSEEILYEMFDPVDIAIKLGFFGAMLLKFGGVF